MASCARCGSELQPAWKFCITCGARTGGEPGDAAAISGTAAVVLLCALALGAAIVLGATTIVLDLL